MEQLSAFLHGFPALCLFLSVLLGTIIGRFHFKGVGFGAVVGTLIAGIVIGIVAKPELPDLLRWTFFYLFLFSIGYSVGPQFFGSLKKDAVPQIVLALVVAVSGLATVIAVSAVFGFDEGLAVGLLSGGMTQSAALGTGLSAIAELPISEAAKTALIANAPLADAITYGFGDLGLILFLTWLGPKIMRADLRSDAKALEQQLSGGKSSGPSFSAAHFSLRAYRLENAALAGSSLAALEERYADERLSVHRVQRDGELLKLEPALALKRGDQIVVSALRGAFLTAEKDIGPEIDDAALLSVPVQTVSVVVTSAAVSGATLESLAQDPNARGVYLESLQRGTELMPREPWTVVQRGDILRIVGAPDDVERAGKHVGFVERDLSKTDLMFRRRRDLRRHAARPAQAQRRWHRPRARHRRFHPGRRSRRRMGAQPLSGVWRDTRAGAAAADGHRPDRVHRRRRHARRASRRRGVSHERRRVFCQHLLRRRDRHDRAAGRGHRSWRATC